MNETHLDLEKIKITEMADHARDATNLLKALAHESRLMILCLLLDGEKSVGQLEELMQMRQPNISQQLARLRYDGLVYANRVGRTIFYSIASPNAKRVIGTLYELYCADNM